MSLFFWCLLLTLCSTYSTAQDDVEPFTLLDFFSGAYGARGYGGVWISDEEIQYRDGEGNIAILNVNTNSSTIVVPVQVLQGDEWADSYVFSPDRQFLLISYNTQSQFRHSTTAQYLVYSLVNGESTQVANGSFLQTATWGPKNLSLLYILDNDIYYTQNISTNDPTRLTHSGVVGVIYNGAPDWVYEEEVIGGATAYWFSPDGSGLVYIQFNDTEVPTMTYTRYGQPGTIEDQYPKQVSIKYPKAGAKNPSHSLFYVNLTTSIGEPESLLVREDLKGELITYGITWAGNGGFTELLKNRVQNESTLVLCDPSNQSCTELMESANTIGWDVNENPVFDSTGRYYLNIESVLNDGTTYRHLVLRDVQNSTSITALTSGKRVVLSVIAWDEKNGVVYYSGTMEEVPSVTQVYQVDINGNNGLCLTCQLPGADGEGCQSASAKFSNDFTNVIISCSGPSPAITAVYKNVKPLEEPFLIMEDNAPLRNALKTKAMPTVYDTTVGVAEGFLANVRLLLPPNFNESKKYPLLIEVYGGPDSTQILDGYSVGWETYLTSSLEVIYGFIDGRGSGRQGDDVLFAGYRNLGTVEIYDQINVTRSLQSELPWIDANRTAIWGWSYGGYATGRTMELDRSGVFKCGISVAPVTSWLYYDSIYTERYLGLPTADDNLDGYLKGDLVSRVENIGTKQYYLIHGNGDDNVHYQQSMLLSRALELNDVVFQQQSYPDENHSLGGVTHHLYHSMEKFWKNCFDIMQ